MKTSVIVPTYNRLQALRLCLLSLAGQSMPPHEVLIADDGSGPETRAMVEAMQEALKDKFPVRHIWQEDIGFRKPLILNETVRQSAGDYLVFIDGDCTAHRHFVKTHVEYSRPDVILSGKRVEIGKELTERLLKEGRVLNSLTLELLWDSLRGCSRKVEEAIGAGNKQAAEIAMKVAEPELMRGAQKGVFHKNTASRKVSRLISRIRALIA